MGKMKRKTSATGPARDRSVSKSTSGNSTPDETEGLLLVQQMGAFGKNLHALLEKLPSSLKITKKDALEMHSKVDENSRLR